ncbi:MAG: hypothetical protein U9Q15_03390 [Patescibacteria group bacterium]|nr:hypothetical protein [Patescibacteria group bacterium]
MEIVHISHRIDKDREYFDVYVRVDSYSGEIKNAEPHKCSELTWIDIDNLEDPALFQHDIQVIKKVRK